MTLDWNWFFAAFAQCASALIAIIAAFIISKLIGEVEKQETHKNNIDQLIIQYDDLIKRISIRKFNWYNNMYIEYDSDLHESIKNKDFNGLNDEEKLTKLYEIIPHLFKTNSCLSALDKVIEEHTPKREPKKQGDYSFINFPEINLPPAIIIPQGLGTDLRNERDAINKLKFESLSLIDQFKKAKIKANRSDYLHINFWTYSYCDLSITFYAYSLR